MIYKLSFVLLLLCSSLIHAAQLLQFDRNNVVLIKDHNVVYGYYTGAYGVKGAFPGTNFRSECVFYFKSIASKYSYFSLRVFYKASSSWSDLDFDDAKLYKENDDKWWMSFEKRPENCIDAEVVSGSGLPFSDEKHVPFNNSIPLLMVGSKMVVGIRSLSVKSTIDSAKIDGISIKDFQLNSGSTVVVIATRQKRANIWSLLPDLRELTGWVNVDNLIDPFPRK